MPSQSSDRAQACDVIVLFSQPSRDAYAAEAAARGETYTFTDAWGLPRTWIKGEYAYLAPNAAGAVHNDILILLVLQHIHSHR